VVVAEEVEVVVVKRYESPQVGTGGWGRKLRGVRNLQQVCLVWVLVSSIFLIIISQHVIALFYNTE
jgi:cytochrome b subunit of formate dehydrogenase